MQACHRLARFSPKFIQIWCNLFPESLEYENIYRKWCLPKTWLFSLHFMIIRYYSSRMNGIWANQSDDASVCMTNFALDDHVFVLIIFNRQAKAFHITLWRARTFRLIHTHTVTWMLWPHRMRSCLNAMHAREQMMRMLRSVQACCFTIILLYWKFIINSLLSGHYRATCTSESRYFSPQKEVRFGK